MDFRPLIFVLVAVGAITWFLFFRGEIELNDDIVTELIDDSDQAYRKGNAHALCEQRAKDFTLYTTMWNFMRYQGPSSYAEIGRRETSFARSNDFSFSRDEAWSHTASKSEYCKDLGVHAEEWRQTYRRRTDLTIHVGLDDKTADYEAEYVFVSRLPEGYEYPKGATGDIYVYSRVTESGNVVLEDYKPVIKSARVKQRKYWVYPAEIPAIDRPPAS